jgi:methylmalonyl-CoA mutase cobalamin-binding subunit
MAAVAGAAEGWQTTYLGPDMPAGEIAYAADQMQAKVVALSIVYPSDDPRVGWELRKLLKFCGQGVVVVVGGRAAEAYAHALDETGVMCFTEILPFRRKLHTLRYGESL